MRKTNREPQGFDPSRYLGPAQAELATWRITYRRHLGTVLWTSKFQLQPPKLGLIVWAHCADSLFEFPWSLFSNKVISLCCNHLWVLENFFLVCGLSPLIQQLALFVCFPKAIPRHQWDVSKSSGHGSTFSLVEKMPLGIWRHVDANFSIFAPAIIIADMAVHLARCQVRDREVSKSIKGHPRPRITDHFPLASPILISSRPTASG
jgi:hypothetical protein